jgi:hypothetical protein
MSKKTIIEKPNSTFFLREKPNGTIQFTIANQVYGTIY